MANKELKVMLIYPPATTLSADSPSPEVPLGLAYIAACLEKEGYPVKILDALAEGIDIIEPAGGGFFRNGLRAGDIAKKIREFNPDVVGVSCSFTAHVDDSLEVARIVKGISSSILVVFGGAHATVDPYSILRYDCVDIIVRGEGEITMLELVGRIASKDEFKGIKGLAFRVDGLIRLTPDRELISDLDSLPLPARHLLPMNIYLGKQKTLRFFSMRAPRTTLVSSRGCRVNCVFCSVKSIWGHSWRARSPEKIVEEIVSLKKEYGIREIYFLDDNVSVDRKRLLRLCYLITERKLDITWAAPNGIALWSLDEEVLRAMKKSGYYRATFGIESGCESTLKFIGKPIDLVKARALIKLCHKIGLWTHSTFVIGFPYETQQDIEITIEFAKSSHLDFATFYIATPYAATRLYEVLKKEGLLDRKDGCDSRIYSSVNLAAYDTVHLKKEELNTLKEKAYREFFIHRILSLLNPFILINELMPKINSWEKLRYFLRLIDNILSAQIVAFKSGQLEIHKKK